MTYLVNAVDAGRFRDARNSSTWKPSNRFQATVNDAIRDARERIFYGMGDPLDDYWVDANFERIIERFAQGHDQKAVAGLMGLPWSEWAELTVKSRKFRQTIELGIQIRLAHFEDMRNSVCRGEHRGSVAAITHALDRQHADAYFGRPGVFNPQDEEDELTLEQAEKILEGYGIQALTQKVME